MRSALAILDGECSEAHAKFVKLVQPLVRSASPLLPRLAACCLVRGLDVATSGPSAPGTCLALAALNQECLRKVCKRIDKSLPPPTAGVSACEWLRMVASKNKFEFMNGSTRTVLALQSGDSELDTRQCPVCLNVMDLKPGDTNDGWSSSAHALQHSAVIFVCGHLACADCVLRACNMRGRKGTLINLLGACRAHGMPCPMCRNPFALGNSTHRCPVVWPARASSMFLEPGKQ